MPEPRLGNFSPLSKERELGLIDQEIARRQSPSTPIPSPSKTDSRLALIDQEIARRKEVAPKVKERGVIGELAAGFGRGALGVVAAPAEIADIAGEAIGWEALEKAGESGAKAIEKYIKESPKLKRTESISKNILKNPELWKDPRWYSSIVGEGLPTILSMFIPGMAAAKAAKVAKLGAKGVRAARIAGGLTAGVGLEAAGAASDVRQYEEQTGEAIPISTKLQTVLGTGIVAGSLEYVPIFAMFGKAGASKLVSRVLTGMATEGTTEGAQELVANAFAKAGYDADQNMVDGVVESIVGGVLLGGGMGAVSRATNFKERVDETNPEEVSEILEQTETEANIPEEQQTEFTRRREETALRTAEERQAAIEAAAPMTTASDETTTLAEEAPRPEPVAEEIIAEEPAQVEEVSPLAEEIPAPLRAMGMRPAPAKPAVEKAAVPFMVTKETEAGLSKLGYTKKDIGKMSPEDALRIVEAKIAKEPVAEEKVVAPEAPEKIEIPTLTDTTQAIAFGEKATPEQITELKRLRKESEARYDVLIKEDKLDEAGREALKAQLYREAYEAREKPKEPKVEKPEIAEKEPWKMTKKEWTQEKLQPIIESLEIGETKVLPDKRVIVKSSQDLSYGETYISRGPVKTKVLEPSEIDQLPDKIKKFVTRYKAGEKELPPIYVSEIMVDSETGKTFREIRDGHHRYYMAEEVGLEELPAMERISDLYPEDHEILIQQAISEGKPVPKEVLAEYPDLAPAKPPPPKLPKPTPSEAVREEIEVEPIAEVAPKVEKKEIIEKLKKKEFYGTIDRLERGEITLEKAKNELEGVVSKEEKEAQEKYDEGLITLDQYQSIITGRKIKTTELNPADYAAELKGKGIGRRESWSEWIKKTTLKPEMDAKDWYKIYDAVKPIPKVEAPVEKVPAKPEPGFAWIKGKQKPILSAREITKGKNKGKYEVTLTKGRDAEGNIIPGAKKIVTEKEIITMPEAKVEVAPIEKAKIIKPIVPGVKPKVKKEKIEIIPTPEGKEITVDLTKKEEAAVTPKQQKTYLLAEIDKAIGEAPKVKPFESIVKEFKKEAKYASPKAYTKLLEKQEKVGAERVAEYGTVTIHVPDDGVFTILNTKQSLEEFKKKAKNFPAVEPKAKKVIIPGVIRKVPSVEKIDELKLTTDGKEYFTDGSVIIKGKPPASAKYGKKEIPHESIKEILAHETKPTELKYYTFMDPDFGEAVSRTPIPQGLATPDYSPMAVFQSKSGILYGYNQFRLNAITKRFPKAKYGIGEQGLLIAYENKKPVAALMNIRTKGENALMENMAVEKGFIKARPIEKPVEEAKSRIKVSTTEILKGERGSFSTETKEGAATFEDFSVVGKDFIKRGADTFVKFTEQMKKTFGEVWESVKHLAKELYTRAKAILTEERGEITIREEQPIPLKKEPKVKKLTPAEKAKEAFKILGIKPKLKPEEPLPKRARSVGLAYQDISEEAKRLEVEVGLEYPKVTRTHAELREQADRIMGDQEQLIKTMEKEKNFTEAEGLVVRRTAATGLESLMKVVATKDIKKANEIHKEFKEGVGKQVQDLHSEFGRNLESLKEKVSPESMSKAFASIERDLNKDDMDMFNSAAEALGQGNAKPMINFQKYLKTTKQDPKIMDYVYEYWYNSILSGVPTHVVNVASNTAWGAWQVGIHKPILAAIDPLVAKFQKRPTEYYMAEVIPALAGIKRGLKPGIKGAKEVIVKGYTTDAELDKFAADMGSSVGAFARSPNKHLRTIAPFLTMPTRALRAMDIWAKQMNYEAELGSVAKRMEKQGKGKYEELLKNPTQDMMNQAAEYADYTTFMGKLGKIGTTVESLRTAVPGGRFIVPFVRTIANLVKRGVEMTPGVGAMKLLGGKVKGKEVTQVLAKQIEGAMIALVIASMFDDDEITGDVPANKAEREAFYRQGKKPWAIKIGDRWYQYRRVEPFNTPVAAVGILYDTWKRTGEEPSTEFAYRSAAGFVNNIIDSSYLSGLTQVLDSVRKADKWPQKLTNMFDKTLASFSPMSSFQRSFVRAIEAIDKEGAILRKPKGAVETVAAATPFLSEMVPARKDVWGKEIMIAGTPLEQWLPWKTAKETDDVVEIEIERLHGAGLMSYPGMPAKYMSIGGKRLDLDDEQYDALITESGQASKKKLDSLVGTKYWGMLSDKEKASRIQKIIKDNRKKARNKIKKEFKVAIPGMVPWKKTKKKKRPAWQETAFGKKAGWQKPMEF